LRRKLRRLPHAVDPTASSPCRRSAHLIVKEQDLPVVGALKFGQTMLDTEPLAAFGFPAGPMARP
jgi:hypothetical protein